MFKVHSTVSLETLTLKFNGESFNVPKGISVAAALLTITNSIRSTPISGHKRGPYCMMGVCFDCLVSINGEQNQQSCMRIVEEGMEIEAQQGAYALGETQ